MKRITLLSLVFILLVSTLSGASGDLLVYRTHTGKKYHRGSCRTLSKSKIELTLAMAVSRGLQPCGICHPPVLDNTESTLSKEAILNNMPQTEVIKPLEDEIVQVATPDQAVALNTNVAIP